MNGERARNEKGQLVADDPSTPDINEAYVGGKKPKKKAELNVLVVPGLPDDYKSQKLALILNCIDKQYYEDFSSWSIIRFELALTNLFGLKK